MTTNSLLIFCTILILVMLVYLENENSKRYDSIYNLIYEINGKETRVNTSKFGMYGVVAIVVTVLLVLIGLYPRIKRFGKYGVVAIVVAVLLAIIGLWASLRP